MVTFFGAQNSENFFCAAVQRCSDGGRMSLYSDILLSMVVLTFDRCRRWHQAYEHRQNLSRFSCAMHVTRNPRERLALLAGTGRSR